MSTRVYRAAILRRVAPAAVGLIGAIALPPAALAQVAKPVESPPTRPSAPRPTDPSAIDTVVVEGNEPAPGSIPGNPTPELVLNPAEIRSYGASSIDELLESLSPALGTTSGRDSGQPVTLLNGRRVSSYNEISTLPTEAIQRVEVFTEDVALEYGYSADQRVVNIVLRRRFRAITTEANAGLTANGAGDQGDAELGDLDLSPKGRVNLDGKIQGGDAVNQLARGVSAPPQGVDDRADRTIVPSSDQLKLTGVWNHVLDRVWAVTTSATFQSSDSRSKLGLDPSSAAAIISPHTTTDGRINVTLDGQTPNWSWTGSVAAEQSAVKSSVLSSLSSNSNNTTTTYEAIANATGAVFDLPAGKVRLSVRGSFNSANLDGNSDRGGRVQTTAIDRSDWGARMTLSVPLTSVKRDVLSAIGDLSAFFSGSVDGLSDFDAVTSYGGGLTWTPTTALHFTVRANHAEAAPSLAQLGQATLVTPGGQIYDPVVGQTVFVATTTGGNPSLLAEQRQDLSLTANWSILKNLTLTGAYTHNATRNALTAFPMYTPALEAAFPSRFARNSSGALVAVDQRAVNLPDRQGQTVRVGLTFNQGFGPKLSPPAFAGGLRRGPNGAAPGAPGAGAMRGRANATPRPQGDEPTTSETGQLPPISTDANAPPDRPSAAAGEGARGGPPGGGFPGGGQGGFPGGGGFRGGGGRGPPPQAGRFSLSLSYTRRLEDSVVLAPGLATIDLLKNAALGGVGGGGPDKLEFEGGVNWRGLGLRLNGAWNGGYSVPGAVPAQGLSFGDVATVGARAFFDFNAYPDWVRQHPFFRGTRILLRVSNLFDAAPKVRDGTGAVPYADQPDLLNPKGMSWAIGLRKLF